MPKLNLACLAACGAALLLGAPAQAQTAATDARPAYDAALAARLGGNDNGMRAYVLVVLKTGPTRVPAGPERDEMFKGHFANMKRLSDAGKLAIAGPFDGNDGWRGMYIFAVPTVEEARTLVATDPVVIQGEMVPEFHALYASAALMLVPEGHLKISKPGT
ncbi:MAG TPA: YciI family protein [Ideonella sp.]|uniref:YciI family protein n=1 Tax=Ideonella sp. TaxID=1929293 RepID=UPI002BD8259B|nr:YciI family protein [Ideonella sp.]HSI50521.1 YciI family protein [Ideonella sp.]